jgi:hypothetical protein
MYYHGLPTDIIAENTKTAHKWGFTKNLTEQARAPDRRWSLSVC